MDAQRALLDALMGKNRNLSADEKGSKHARFDDKDVCQWYNLSFCPHELFVNTRSDLGPCPNEHDPKLKEQYVQPCLLGPCLLVLFVACLSRYEAEAKKNPRLQVDLERRFVSYLEALLDAVDKR